MNILEMANETSLSSNHSGVNSTICDVSSSINDRNHLFACPSPVFLPCNNPRNIVSPHVAEMVDFVMFAGIIPVFVTWGVISNVMNMVVFSRQGLSDRINLCLFSLAVSDTGYLLFLMSGKSFILVRLVDSVAGNYWRFLHQRSVMASTLGFLAISSIITALIAVERCICVVMPLKAAKILKTRYMRLLIVVVAVYILIVMNTNFSLKYQTVQVTDSLTNTATFIARLSPFYPRIRVLDDIGLYVILITLPFLSLVVVIACTTVIIVRLKITAAWRRETVSNMTSVEKQEVTVTRMLVTVCCVYVTCMTPTVTRSFVIFVEPAFLSTGYLCNIFKISMDLSHLLEVLNTSSNFLIYIKQSSRYRSTLSKLFHCNSSRQKGAMSA
ncbi:hypothetical protein ACOMHN_050125 [Nucella lapillus]